MPWMLHKDTGEIHMVTKSPYGDSVLIRILCCPCDVTAEGKLASGCYDSVMVDDGSYELADKPIDVTKVR